MQETQLGYGAAINQLLIILLILITVALCDKYKS